MRAHTTTLSLREIEDWVMNDEPLYRWMQSEDRNVRRFCRNRREELTKVILATLNRRRLPQQPITREHLL